MSSRLIGRLLVYPVVLLCGVALGTDFGSRRPPLYPSGQNPSEAGQESSLPISGRKGAESAELRALRRAERELFPEVSLDSSAADVASWDYSPEENARLERGGAPGDFLAGLVKPELPVRRHQRVSRYINYFSKNDQGRKLFRTWLQRSGHYRPLIENELVARGLPLDLQALVFVESGFWPTARSSAGAVGLWQFMPRTARAYGLIVDRNYDERRSIWRSTEAAAQHLEDLHEYLGSWDLALAAYNYGHDNVTRRMRQVGANDFWDLANIEGALPRETALYVPKILAIAVILRNLEHFGFDDVELGKPFEAVAIKVPPGVRLSLIARAAGTTTRFVRELNPEIREDVIPDRGGPVVVRIPRRGLSRARAMLPQLLDQTDSGIDLQASLDFDWGEDEFGMDGRSPLDRLSGLGTIRDSDSTRAKPKPVTPARQPKRSATKAKTIAKEPKAAPAPRVASKRVASVEAAPPAPKRRIEPKPPPAPTHETVVHRVEFGDTVFDIAARYGVSTAHVIRYNQLKNPDQLIIGTRLKMRVPIEKKSEGSGGE